MKTDIVLKTLVVNSDGKVLLLRRSNTDTRRPLQWDLPGGMMDEGETLEQGAVREVKEESGLEIANQPKVIFSKTEKVEWTDDQGLQQRNTTWIYFVAHIDDTEVSLSFEHDQHKWVTLEEAISMIEYSRHKEMVQHIIDNNIEL